MKMFLLLLSNIAVCLAVIDPSMQRAIELVRQMSLKEKVMMLHGHVDTFEGQVYGNERLGIPSLKMQDGPQGFRVTGKTGEIGSTTAWPSELTIASSWDESLVLRWSQAMAMEFKHKGANMILGPGIGIARSPNAGRNFEYLCGEDPTLGSKLVTQAVRGIQSQGIIANAKHWVNNEIETTRMSVSANVDVRTRFELYYPPFQAAIDAGVLSVMCSYNRINDVYSCHNNETLYHLKGVMGFKGFVVSDWFAAATTAQALKAGLDLEMPIGIYYADAAVEAALFKRDIAQSDVDRAVTNVLYSMIAIGMLDNEPVGNPMNNVTSEEHNALAREIAAKSTVLLKNEAAFLPLSPTSLSGCVAVFGDELTVSGQGSGHVKPPYVITPTVGLENALQGSGVSVVYCNSSDLSEVVELAAKCSISIVVVATNSIEGSDRESLSLGNGQDELVAAVAAVNGKRTVVSVVTPGAVLMPWTADVAAVLVSWMPGQEAGNALADVLFGKVNPSARLPVTMPNKENEVGFTPDMFPGVGIPPEAAYSEALLIGYRWYNAHQVSPKYAFGFGLSYTTFSYSAPTLVLAADASSTTTSATVLATVSLTVTNTGAVDGDEVVQLYISYPPAAGEPPMQLRDFQKVFLKAGEVRTVSLSVTRGAVSVFVPGSMSWMTVPGQYAALIGAASDDIRGSIVFSL